MTVPRDNGRSRASCAERRDEAGPGDEFGAEGRRYVETACAFYPFRYFITAAAKSSKSVSRFWMTPYTMVWSIVP